MTFQEKIKIIKRDKRNKKRELILPVDVLYYTLYLIFSDHFVSRKNTEAIFLLEKALTIISNRLSP